MSIACNINEQSKLSSLKEKTEDERVMCMCIICKNYFNINSILRYASFVVM